MTNFHGTQHKHSFFEGWYLKHQYNNHTLCVIPAFHINSKGDATASIQIITDNASFTLPFMKNEIKISKNRFEVRIGDNTFTEKGMRININTKQLTINGSIKYSDFTPLKYDIMGPFQYLKGMQCNHGVLSLGHELHGVVVINGERMGFNGGTGYIEKDWGTSFPKTYFWTQCNWLDGRQNCIMASVANVPFLAGAFRGCICSIYYHGKEYRLATYKGVKIIECTDKLVVLQQGKYRLEIYLLEHHSHQLQAPNLGEMTRLIHESPSCKLRYRFSINNLQIFDISKDNASCELVIE